MITEIRVRFDRILIVAIAISLAWHLFWVFGVTVIVAPAKTGAVKFSKVSFLGPILERGALEVRVARGERTFLEKRYLAQISRMAPVIDEAGWYIRPEDLIEKDIHALNGPAVVKAVKEALSASKLEPDYGLAP